MSRKKTAKSKKSNLKTPNTKTTKKSANRRMQFTLATVLALFAMLLYANTLSHDYALDDFSAIKDNYVTQRGFDGLGDIFTKHYRYGYWQSAGTLYRPISLAMFAVEWELAGESPGLNHAVNILLYGFTAFLLFLVLCKLMPDRDPFIPLVASLIFVAHPLHVEVVANIKSRDEILAFLFSFAAIYSLIKYITLKDVKWLVGGAGFYLIAMFSKESAITFLAIFPLIGYFFFKKNLLDSILPGLVFLIPAGIYLAVRFAVLGSVDVPAPPLDNVIAASDNFIEQRATAFVFAGKYLKNIVWPTPLGSDFGLPQYVPTTFGDWRALLSLLAFLGIGVIGLLQFKKRSLVSFAILFFLATFSVASNIIILIGTSYGDRMMYAPVLGFSLLVAWGLDHFLNKETYGSKAKTLGELFGRYTIPLGIAGVVALGLSVLTVQRNPAWKNSFSLYETDIKVAPNSAKLNFHYGLELNKKGAEETVPAAKGKWWDQAMFQFNRAIELYPTYADAFAQRGLMYYKLKDYPKALADYETSLRYKPGKAKVYSNMGTVYFETGRQQEAIQAYEKAVKLDERFVDARRNLGSVYAMTKQFDKALVQYTEALKYEPDNAMLHFYIGSVYRDKGDAAKGQQWLEKAYRLDPSLRK